MRTFFPVLGLSLIFSLSACGGGGGGGGATTSSTVNVSGRVTYTDFNISPAGIDYANPINKPIRGAVVELHNPLGTIQFSANTTETGDYSFIAPLNTSTISIVVKAALGTPTAPETKIIDNTNNNALYSLTIPVTTVTSDVTTNFNAPSGWDVGANSFTATRTSAPFAILDTIHQGRLFVQAADAAVVFPALSVQWSTSNKTAVGTQNIAIGDGPGTSYGAPNLWLNGSANLDTDEYDSTVIAHEWGHYFQEKLSASDSPGGSHDLSNSVDLSLAFDEGFATAMGSMIMNDPAQINTMGLNQAVGSVLTANIEADSRLDTATNPQLPLIPHDGFYSEASTIEVVWDLFDSGLAGAADDDGVALGFTPLYKVMTNGHKDTNAFTSIFSFVHFLKLEVPASSGAIDAVLFAENIDTSGANEFEKPSIALYTKLTAGVVATTDSDGNPLQTLNFFGTVPPVGSGEPLGGNKFLNYLAFKVTIPTAGCYTFTATPIGAAAATTDLVMGISGLGGGKLNNNPVGTPEVFSTSLVASSVGAFSIGALTNNAFFTFGYALAADPSVCN